MMNLKAIFFTPIVIMEGILQAQSIVFFKNFESLKSGQNIVELQKNKSGKVETNKVC